MYLHLHQCMYYTACTIKIASSTFLIFPPPLVILYVIHHILISILSPPQSIKSNQYVNITPCHNTLYHTTPHHTTPYQQPKPAPSIKPNQIKSTSLPPSLLPCLFTYLPVSFQMNECTSLIPSFLLSIHPSNAI